MIIYSSSLYITVPISNQKRHDQARPDENISLHIQYNTISYNAQYYGIGHDGMIQDRTYAITYYGMMCYGMV